MATERQIAANRRNARLSTGPHDATRTRLNAVTHGVLSQETVVVDVASSEDVEAFERLLDGLWDDLAPVGALEELFVDRLGVFTWRWRRLLAFETASMRSQAAIAEHDWEQEQIETVMREGPSEVASSAGASEGIALAQTQAYDLRALRQRDLHNCGSDLLGATLAVLEEMGSAPMADSPGAGAGLEPAHIERVITSACAEANRSEAEFWAAVMEKLHEQHAEQWKRLAQRGRARRRRRATASMSDDSVSQKVQRYEAHLLRQFERSLHELQRLQTARLGHRPPSPVVMDIDVDVTHSHGG